MFPVYLCAAIVDIAVDGAADLEDGRAWFVAPFAGKILRVFISAVAAPDVDTTFNVKAPQGTGPTIGTMLDTVGDGDPVEFTLDKFEETNFLKTGEGFAIESGGEGAVVASAGVVVEFAPS